MLQGADDRPVQRLSRQDPTKVSWETDLKKYISDPERLCQPSQATRTQLAAAVLANPKAADPWWDLLYHEELAAWRSGGGAPTPSVKRSSDSIMLQDLYDWATRLVPPEGNKDRQAFPNIWLGHARQQWLRGNYEAQDYIKALKQQQIGVMYAPLYAEWAGIEAASGRTAAALSVVKKGLKQGAQPAQVLEEMQRALETGTYVYVPFWTVQGFGFSEAAASATGPLAPLPRSEADFATPSCRVEHKTVATPTVSSLAGPRPTTATKAAASLLDEAARGHTQTLPATSWQPQAPKTCTSVHSGSSSGTVGSDDPTATLRTLRATGATSVRSASSSGGSADDEATVSLARSRLGPSSTAASRGEDTIVINRSALRSVVPPPLSMPGLGAAPSPAAPSPVPAVPQPGSALKDGAPGVAKQAAFRMRVLGGLGKAVRVTPAAIPEEDCSAANASTDEDDAAARKRKAAAEGAQSPLPALSVGNGKRRQSPVHTENGRTRGAEAAPARQVVLGDPSAAGVDDETAPIMMNQLAQKVQRGRQSIAPHAHAAAAPPADVQRMPPPPAVPSVSQAMPPPPPRTAMGPPPAVPPRKPGAVPAAPPATRPTGRKVIEDENTVTVKDITYTKLECVGRGGSSKVYKVMAPNRKIFALKRIRLPGRDSEAATGFMDEITLLTKLRGRSNIIQLVDAEIHKAEGLIYMVLECGDIDLARLLQRHEAARRERLGGSPPETDAPDVDENFIRLYWEQMLHAVDTIHKERIVHSDLKPANFLMVEGQLKLIDFGIAKAIQSGKSVHGYEAKRILASLSWP